MDLYQNPYLRRKVVVVYEMPSADSPMNEWNEIKEERQMYWELMKNGSNLEQQLADKVQAFNDIGRSFSSLVFNTIIPFVFVALIMIVLTMKAKESTWNYVVFASFCAFIIAWMFSPIFVIPMLKATKGKKIANDIFQFLASNEGLIEALQEVDSPVIMRANQIVKKYIDQDLFQ